MKPNSLVIGDGWEGQQCLSQTPGDQPQGEEGRPVGVQNQSREDIHEMPGPTSVRGNPHQQYR